MQHAFLCFRRDLIRLLSRAWRLWPALFAVLLPAWLAAADKEPSRFTEHELQQGYSDTRVLAVPRDTGESAPTREGRLTSGSLRCPPDRALRP